MSYIYLASPYKHPNSNVMQSRFESACRAAAEILNTGRLVYSPIVHNHPIAIAHELPRDWNFWKRQDFAMLRHADEFCILTLEGWLESEGVQAELQLAHQLGLPIAYMP